MSRIVNTKYGKIKGYERNNIVEYLGIPFAKPLVGELRFKRAVEVDSWNDIFDASHYGPCSLQMDNGKVIGSEDCLTLNIQAPLNGNNFPVLIWIHGGSYNTGSASGWLTDGLVFAKEGICYVSIQYRLNVLGFYDFTTYKHCENFDSNCGLSDQILAIKWVHENIASFGGNPKNVTLMGESAGGASVINLMSAPSVKGMFQKAIVQSGLPNCVISHKMARENIDLFIEGMGWTEDDLIKLKDIDTSELEKGNAYMVNKYQYKNPGIFLLGPTQDDLLPDRPIDAITKGNAKGVILLIGTNLNEGTMFVHPEKTELPNSWEMIETMFKLNGNEKFFPLIKEYYKKFNDTALTEFATDYVFQIPSIKVALSQSLFEDVFIYKLEYISKTGKENGMGASHAYELPLVFKDTNFEFSKMVYGNDPVEDVERISNEMFESWKNFIINDKPNGEAWPNFCNSSPIIRIFDKNTVSKILDKNKLMELWKDLKFYEN